VRPGETHLLFVWRSSGYELVEEPGHPPPVGTEVDRDGARLRIAKVAPSPLPGDERFCAYLAS